MMPAPILSTAETRTVIVDAIDAYIAERVHALETQIRADLAATATGDDSDLDVPPDPHAAWCRITVEEILSMEQAQLESWRDALLDSFDRRP